MIYNDLLSFHYKYYLNGDVVIYPITERPINELTDFDRKKGRKFQLTYSKYRLLSCAAVELIKTAKNKVIFLTLTFPNPITDEKANRVWNTFIKNFRKTYHCNDYMGVLEHTQKGNPHYHFLADYPFQSVASINAAFSSAYTSVTGNSGSNNMVRLPKNSPSVVGDAAGMVRYLCKYFSKSRGQHYTARCYFISRGLRQRIEPIELTPEQYRALYENLNAAKVYNFDHCSVNCFEATKANELVRSLINEPVLTNKINPNYEF